MRNNFGTFLRNLRKQRNLTLKELGDITGISYAQISKIERNLHTPSVETIEKLSKSLAYDIYELLELGNYKEPINIYNIDKTTRYNILLKYNNACQICGARAPYNVIYVSPIKLEGDVNDIHTPSNLITLCNDCHEARQQSISSDGITNDYLYNKHYSE